MELATILPNLSVPSIALAIMYFQHKEFLKRLREKDQEMIVEGQRYRDIIEKHHAEMRELEREMRKILITHKK